MLFLSKSAVYQVFLSVIGTISSLIAAACVRDVDHRSIGRLSIISWTVFHCFEIAIFADKFLFFCNRMRFLLLSKNFEILCRICIRVYGDKFFKNSIVENKCNKK